MEKKDIEESFDNFFENFNANKVKIKEKIEKEYNETIRDIDDILKSQNLFIKILIFRIKALINFSN